MFVTKIDKNTLLRAHFSALNRFWVDFWAPAGSQNEPKSSNFAEDGQHFWRYFFEVVLRGCLQTFWDRSGRLRGRSGDPPGGFPEAFWRIFLEKIRCENNDKNGVENLTTLTLSVKIRVKILHHLYLRKTFEPNPAKFWATRSRRNNFLGCGGLALAFSIKIVV